MRCFNLVFHVFDERLRLLSKSGSVMLVLHKAAKHTDESAFMNDVV